MGGLVGGRWPPPKLVVTRGVDVTRWRPAGRRDRQTLRQPSGRLVGISLAWRHDHALHKL